jgi:predicted amidophosphoribosyltransferase
MYCPSCGNSNPSGATYCMGCGKQLPSFTTSVRCPFCGADGQEYQFNCTKCGKDLPRGQKIDPMSGTATPSGATKPCPICGRPMGIYANQCAYCSRPETDYSYGTEEVYASDSQLPVVGGVLILIAGILGILEGLLTLAAVSSVSAAGYTLPGSVTCCAGLLCIFGLIAAAGSFSAIGRHSVVFAIVGGVFGILAIGFLIGAVLALIGIILVAIAHDEFSE